MIFSDNVASKIAAFQNTVLGVGTFEDFVLIKFALIELHFIEIIVDRSWDIHFTWR